MWVDNIASFVAKRRKNYGEGHTMKDVVLKYPIWQEPYRAAVIETNSFGEETARNATPR
jgi:hypothetical protein